MMMPIAATPATTLPTTNPTKNSGSGGRASRSLVDEREEDAVSELVYDVEAVHDPRDLEVVTLEDNGPLDALTLQDPDTL
jgi:hypothetical protein